MSTPDPIDVALRVSRTLDAQGIQHTIGGSIAASFAGEPRSTIDIDFIVALDLPQVRALVDELSAEFYVDAGAIERAIRSRSSANLIHQGTQLKVDLFIAGGTPLDAQQLERRRRVDVRPGQSLYVHPPEDILLQKLRWFRMGGEVSDRQWRDILGIIRAQGTRLDRAYLDANAVVMEVKTLLERAMREA